MARITNIGLLVLQWLLVLWGVFLIVSALHFYRIEVSYFSGLPTAEAGGDYYRPPTRLRMMTGVGMGLIMLGLGALLFYLRRLYLARRA